MEKCPTLGCFYAILGVERDSSTAEIRTAYRKLAMRWHPDKCNNEKGEAREQAKLKFQAVQEAYSVLSDESKRLLYDAGLHEEVEHDPSMQEFMGELVNMMNGGPVAPTKSNADTEFEELRKLFMNIVDPDNYVRDCEQFDYSCRSSRDTSETTFIPEQAPIPYVFGSDCDQSSFSCTYLDTSKQPAVIGKSLGGSPKPHANLYVSRDYDQFDYISDSFEDDTVTVNLECKLPWSTPHVPPYTHDCQFVDFALLSCSRGPPESTKSRAYLFKRDEQLDSARVVARTVKVNSCSQDCAEIKSGVDPRSSPVKEGFCMGTRGDGPGRDYRAFTKNSKQRRKRCKDASGNSIFSIFPL